MRPQGMAAVLIPADPGHLAVMTTDSQRGILPRRRKTHPQLLALALAELLTVERLLQIEESSDKVTNPSLLELRRLAVVLKTAVDDLAEPDLDERMIAVLQEFMLGRVEARFGMSSRDQRKVFKRILYRVLDKTEED